MPLDRPFTTRQAATELVSDRLLGRMVSLGLLRRVLKGVYAVAQLPDSRELRGRALGLTAPPGSVVADWTANWFWTGVDHPGSRDGVPPLTMFRFRGHERLRNQLVTSGQRWFLPSDVVPLDGHVMISVPLRTAWDLGRLYPRIIAIGGMDALARTGAFTIAQLTEDVERFRGQRGVVQLRELAPLVDPRAESTGESALRLRWLDVPGLPAPEPQIPVYDESGRLLYRIDLGVEELRFGAEYDGEQWHSSPEDQEHDRLRRDELARRWGWNIEVFRKEHVFGQHEDATARLPRALRAARQDLVRRLALV